MAELETATTEQSTTQSSQQSDGIVETARPSTSTMAMLTDEETVRETIRNEVFDPELGLNIVDLGLIYDITVAAHKADITMTLTSPGCPVGPELITNVRRSLARYEDIDEVEVHLVFSPPWHPSMMSEEAKDEMGYFG